MTHSPDFGPDSDPDLSSVPTPVSSSVPTPVSASVPDAASARRRPLCVRELPEAQVDGALDLCDLVFHNKKPSDEVRAHQREVLSACERVAAYDGPRLVGLVAAHRFSLSVPGGELPCAALDFVSVAPTHRRRGALSAMMDELWRRCAAAGQPLARLWASEATIYGRFGFAPGTEACTVEINSDRPLALRIAPDERPLNLVDAADAPARVRSEPGAQSRRSRQGRDVLAPRYPLLGLRRRVGAATGGRPRR